MSLSLKTHVLWPQQSCSLNHFTIIPFAGKDYDEFKAFVACSQLNPIKSSELSQLIQPHGASVSRGRLSKVPQQKSKTLADDVFHEILGSKPQSEKKSTKNKGKTTTDKRVWQDDGARQAQSFSAKLPTTASQMERDWRKYCQTIEAKTFYMEECLTPVSRFVAIFEQKALDPSIMSDIFDVMQKIVEEHQHHQHELDGNDALDITMFVYNWIEALTQCERFNLNLSFMDRKRTDILQRIFEWLHGSFPNDSDYQERVLSLQEIYGVTC